tara:strand:- start:495 stop:1823 length:1329 start_codon:yes stop_codon:yes gene_type:complete
LGRRKAITKRGNFSSRINLSCDTLAINGGTPIRTLPWKDNFTTGEEEKSAVLRVLDSGYMSLFEGSHTPDPPFKFEGGPEVTALEKEWCNYYGIEHSISVNSATSGLYAAIGALEIGYGDEVIVSPYTMTACAMAPLIYGAIPVFADVELEFGSLDPVSVERCITSKTKAIMVVHQFGIPANMDGIMNLARKYNLYVIEDCAQAHGAMYKDKFVGTFGDIGVFSLNVNKSIQTGEGGVCVTNNKEIAYRLQLIRNHGEAVVEKANYKNITNIAGFNYRMTEVQAAIGREQLKKLDDLNRKRIELVDYLISGVKDLPFLEPFVSRENCISTYYVFPIRYKQNQSKITRNIFVRALNAEGALFYQGYAQPLYLQPVYQKKHLFKSSYPFSAPANYGTLQKYNKGLCVNCEQLHFNEMIINEHIRPPHTKKDIKDLLEIISKVVC